LVDFGELDGEFRIELRLHSEGSETKGTTARSTCSLPVRPNGDGAPSRKEKSNVSTTVNAVNAVKPSKASALAAVRALIAGTQKHTPNGSLTFGNATYAAASLVQMFQNLADAMTAHDVAQAKAKDVLVALRDVVAKVSPVLRAYRRFLVATYGNATETLADYGLKPLRAKVPQSSEQKAQAAAKRKATRIARGTKSKKQKASIHGVVTAPAATPPAPPPPPKPAT
jgi:hypothetical protein